MDDILIAIGKKRTRIFWSKVKYGPFRLSKAKYGPESYCHGRNIDQNLIAIGENGPKSYCHRRKMDQNLIVIGKKGTIILLP